MDVSDSVSNREIAGLNRLLKERTENFARESDETRSKFKEKTAAQKAQQAENLEEFRAKSEESANNLRKTFDRNLDRTVDTYERRLADERRDSYDRYGKVNQSGLDDKNKVERAYQRQIQELVDSTKTSNTGHQDEYNRKSTDLLKKVEDDKVALKRSFDASISKQKSATDEQLSRVANDARDKIDANTRSASEALIKERVGADLKYKKAVDESLSNRKTLHDGFERREHQIISEKGVAEDNLSKGSAKTFENYRSKMAENASKSEADLNTTNARKAQAHTDHLAKLEHEHQMKMQDQAASFRKAQNTVTSQLAMEKERADSKSGVDERRHKQEIYLNSETQKSNNDLQRNILAERYSNQLADIEEKHQSSLQNVAIDSQKRLAEQAQRNNAERSAMQTDREAALTKEMLKGNQDKYNIVRTYEGRQAALDEMHKRQAEEQKAYYLGEGRKTHEDATRNIFKTNRDNQARLYDMQEQLKSRTNELEFQRKNDLDLQNQQTQARVKRITDAYNKAIVKQQEGFNDLSDTLKTENTSRFSQLRNDSEHEKRIQFYDLQAKNRSLITTFEARMNQVKDEHTAEVEKLKTDNDKLLRDTLKQTKNTIEQERKMHAMELDSKERQMKDKLKSQEDAFKDQIEKMKRSHELALKKS